MFWKKKKERSNLNNNFFLARNVFDGIGGENQGIVLKDKNGVIINKDFFSIFLKITPEPAVITIDIKENRKYIILFKQ